MDWDAALRRMRAGEFDVIDSIVETPERRDYFDFTPAYATIEGDADTPRTVSDGFAAIEPGEFKKIDEKMVWPHHQQDWALPHLRGLRSGRGHPAHRGPGRMASHAPQKEPAPDPGLW